MPVKQPMPSSQLTFQIQDRRTSQPALQVDTANAHQSLQYCGTYMLELLKCYPHGWSSNETGSSIAPMTPLVLSRRNPLYHHLAPPCRLHPCASRPHGG